MRGTDVHPFYQRGLNWRAAPDLHFVWVKVSDGGSAYSTVQQGVKYVPDTHVAGAKAAGLPVGGYHYAQLSPGPERQADVLLAEVRRLGATGVAPMLDLEAPFRPDSTAKAFGAAFCRRVAAAEYRPAVYMSASFATALRPDQWGIPGLVIVIARYGARPEAPGSGQYVGRYDVHQYTSGGALPGSAGLVDFDESYTTAHLLGAAPNGEEPDMDATQNRALFEVLEQLVGTRDLDKYPGWDKQPPKDFTKATLVDFVRQTHAELKALQAAATPTIDYAKLAAALPPAMAEDIAERVAVKLAARLAQ